MPFLSIAHGETSARVEPACGQELARVSAPPSAPRPTFPDLEFARRRLLDYREILERFLSPDEFERMRQAFRWGAREDSENSPALRALAEIYRRGQEAAFHDLSARADSLRRELAAMRVRALMLNNKGTAEKAANLLVHLQTCLDTARLDGCAHTWNAIHRLQTTPLMPVLPRPDQPPSTKLPIDEVDTLEFLSPAERRDLKMFLEQAFGKASAVQRERIREDSVATGVWRSNEHTFIPDLNLALKSFFASRPKALLRHSKVLLTGKVRLGEELIKVAITFDPRSRYFTITPPPSDETRFLYYEARLSPDGHLVLLSLSPISKAEVRAKVATTHFAY